MNVVGRLNIRKLLEHKAHVYPDKVFVIFEESDGHTQDFTYGDFNRMVNRTANGLLSLGVRKGDKVNLHLTNCPEFLFFWFACAKIGAVMMPSNPSASVDELAYLVDHSESVLSVTQPDLLPMVEAVRAQCPQLQQVILCRGGQNLRGVRSFATLVEDQADELAAMPLEPGDEAAIMYTSGTTARPKGVVVTHANYVYEGEVVSKVMRLGPEDRHLVVLPLYHGNAQFYSFMTALSVGASVALVSRFSASRFMKQAIRYRCTVASLFAAPIRMILAQPEDPADLNNRLRLVIFAQNVTEGQLGEWHRRFGAPLMQIYGMTEIMGTPLANPLDYPRDNMSMGRVTLGFECRVVDAKGRDLASGVPGQILVRGEPGVSIMKGYFKNHDATDHTIRDGWLWTGDIARVDGEGYFHFVDRAKNMIKRAGENISTAEVEAVLKLHPQIADAAVIGVPDKIRDEAIKAYIILRGGESLTDRQVIDFCSQRLSKFRVPEFVEFMAEFPRTSVGKIQKHLLGRRESS